MAKRSTIKYNPALSVKENATANGVSESAIRRYIAVNHIDRRQDASDNRRRTIAELKRNNHDISAREIMRLTGFSIHTVRKYRNDDRGGAEIDTLEISKNAPLNTSTIIKSVGDNQYAILHNILHLYVKKETFDCDFTYSIGNFYKYLPKPALKFDKYPQFEEVRPLSDAECLPDGSLHSVVVDLPFIVKPQYNVNELSKITHRFNCFATVKDLYEANDYMIALSYRVLDKDGYLIMKTMDICQLWVSDYVYQKATSQGYELVDKFILISNSRYFYYHGEQRHARKYHCYFLVFRKK